MVTTTSFYGVEVAGHEGPPAAPADEVLRVFELMKPRRSETPLIRIGGDIDGAYLVPDALEGISACFSPGVNRIKYFEDFLTDHYGIASHMCDFTCDVADFKTPLREGMQTFAKKWLDVTPGEDNVSLEDWVREHEPVGDLMLQIDIEGAEYRNILATSDETLARFRLVVIEVHGLGKMLEAPVLRDVIAPFFEKLSRSFTSVHAHPNNCCGEVTVPGTDVTIPQVLELTLVRNDHFRPAPGPPSLPHPLDVSRNVPRKPPLFLSEAWCDHDRPLESRVKILEDTARYRDEVGTATAESEMASVLALTMQALRTVTDAVPETPVEDLEEVAAGRPYRLSSAYGTTSRTGLVRPREAYFFHTEFASNQSIRVDLGARRRVRRIEVTNRTDGHQDRARFIFVTLSGGGTGAPSVFPMYHRGKLDHGAWSECGIDVPETLARYVTISSPVNTALHFSDLRVYAVGEDDPTAAPDPAPLVGRAVRSLRSRVPGGSARSPV